MNWNLFLEISGVKLGGGQIQEWLMSKLWRYICRHIYVILDKGLCIMDDWVLWWCLQRDIE